MINDCRYDKIKLVYRLCKMIWFIEKYGLEDAKKANEDQWHQLLQDLKYDLKNHLEKLEKEMCK